MVIYEFIEGEKPSMVLIHGVLTPWQIWLPQIQAFQDQYNIYAVALNAHTEETASEFVSVLAEAEEIMQYLIAKKVDTVDVLCGLSLGGKIAHEIWKSGKIRIHNLILDGAPLAACPGFAIKIMIRNYKDIIHGSKNRNDRVMKGFKTFLPEKYLDNYLAIADRFSDKSVENIVNSVFAGGNMEGVDNRSRILFLHGTKPNEVLSWISARRMKKLYPETEVVCFKGDAHCHKVIFQPEKWISVVRRFLQCDCEKAVKL